MKAVEVLVKARELISDPRNHIKGALYRRVAGRDCYCSAGAALTAAGCLVEGRDADGVSSSCIGSIFVETTDDSIWVGKAPASILMELAGRGIHAKAADTALNYLNATAKGAGRAGRNGGIVGFNDTSSHARVLAVFDEAIRRAKRRHINGKNYASGQNRA